MANARKGGHSPMSPNSVSSRARGRFFPSIYRRCVALSAIGQGQGPFGAFSATAQPIRSRRAGGCPDTKATLGLARAAYALVQPVPNGKCSTLGQTRGQGVGGANGAGARPAGKITNSASRLGGQSAIPPDTYRLTLPWALRNAAKSLFARLMEPSDQFMANLTRSGAAAWKTGRRHNPVHRVIHSECGLPARAAAHAIFARPNRCRRYCATDSGSRARCRAPSHRPSRQRRNRRLRQTPRFPQDRAGRHTLPGRE